MAQFVTLYPLGDTLISKGVSDVTDKKHRHRQTEKIAGINALLLGRSYFASKEITV